MSEILSRGMIRRRGEAQGLLHGLKCRNKADARVLYYAHGRKYHSLGEGGTCGVTEAARILGYSQDTVRRMIEDGELIGWRARRGGRKFFDVQGASKRCRIQGTGSGGAVCAGHAATDAAPLILPQMPQIQLLRQTPHLPQTPQRHPGNGLNCPHERRAKTRFWSCYG